MKQVWTIGLGLLFFFVNGCTLPKNSSGADRGVEVGNGLKYHYLSPYFFSLTYDSTLSFQKTSHEEFTFRNPTEFDVRFRIHSGSLIDDKPIEGFDDLWALAKKECGKEPKGGLFNDFLPEISCSQYATGIWTNLRYLMPRNGKVIEVFSRRHGDLATPHEKELLDSLHYDQEPPRFLSFANREVVSEIGPNVMIAFSASDSCSGLDKFISYTLASSNTDFETTMTTDIRKLDRPLSFALPLSTNPLAPGSYYFKRLKICDRARNCRLLRSLHPKSKEKRTQNVLPDFSLRITGVKKPGKPKLKSVEIVSPLRAGGKGVVYVEVAPRSSVPRNVPLAWGTFVPSFPTVDSAEISLYEPAIPVAGKKDTYKIDFTVGKFIPPGDYYLSGFAFGDDPPLYNYNRTGTKDPRLLLRVQNDLPDTDAPIVIDFRVLKTEVQRGSKLRFLMAASDDVSGLSDTLPLWGATVKQSNGECFSISDGHLEQIDPSTFLVSLDMPEVARGELLLRDLRVQDRAGNQTNISYNGYEYRGLAASANPPAIKWKINN